MKTRKWRDFNARKIIAWHASPSAPAVLPGNVYLVCPEGWLVPWCSGSLPYREHTCSMRYIHLLLWLLRGRWPRAWRRVLRGALPPCWCHRAGPSPRSALGGGRINPSRSPRRVSGPSAASGPGLPGGPHTRLDGAPLPPRPCLLGSAHPGSCAQTPGARLTAGPRPPRRSCAVPR